MNDSDTPNKEKPRLFNHNIASVIIAAIAVALSQFPPLHTYFQTSELKMTIPQRLMLQPNFPAGVVYGLKLKLNNVGDKVSNVLAVQLIFEKNGKVVENIMSTSTKHLNNYSVLAIPLDESFTDFYVPPSDNVAQFYSFYKRADAHEAEIRVNRLFRMYLKEYQDWEQDSTVRAVSNIAAGELLPEASTAYEMSDSLHDHLSSKVRRKLSWWQLGEYKLSIVVYTNEEVVLESFSFDITKDTMAAFFVALKHLEPTTFTNKIYKYFEYEMGTVSFDLTPIDGEVSAEVKKMTNNYHKSIRP